MISFIIPTKNEEKVLEHTLSSLGACTVPHEIIISDGKSTDKTLAIASQYTKKVVVYGGTEKQTIAAGRNAGALSAEGDTLVFLDADVTVPDISNFMRKVTEIFAHNKNIVALTVPFRVLESLETFPDRIMAAVVSFLYTVSNNILGLGAASGEFMVVQEKAFRKIGGFNPLLVAAEDQDLFQRLRKVGKTRFERTLCVYHTGRRAHQIGWPRLIGLWLANGLSQRFFGRSASKEWKEIR